MKLNEFILKLNEQEDDYPRPKEELQKLISIIEKEKDFVEILAKEAQQITTEIKYDDTVMGIILRIRKLSEKITFDDRGYKGDIESAISDAQEAMNSLESAVYGIDEPFKYLLRTLDNELSELEMEMDEHKWKRESVDTKLKISKQRDPNWKTMQSKATSGAGGSHKDRKYAEKKGDVKHKKDKIPMEGWKDTVAGLALGAGVAMGGSSAGAADRVPDTAKEPIIATVVIDGEAKRLDLTPKGFDDVKEAERFLKKFLADRGIKNWQAKIERSDPGTGKYQRLTISGMGGLD